MRNNSIYTILQILFGISLTCFSACNYPYQRNAKLLQAEELMETSPDSSLAILQNIESPEKLANKDYAFYCLLLTQALDKNYSIHTSDSLIKKATAYFEQHSDDAALALSYYYMGRVYSDMHDALQAQQYYLKALELGENLNSPPTTYQDIQQPGYSLQFSKCLRNGPSHV